MTSRFDRFTLPNARILRALKPGYPLVLYQMRKYTKNVRFYRLLLPSKSSTAPQIPIFLHAAKHTPSLKTPTYGKNNVPTFVLPAGTKKHTELKNGCRASRD